MLLLTGTYHLACGTQVDSVMGPIHVGYCVCGVGDNK